MLKTRYFKLVIALICLMGASIISSAQKGSVERIPRVEDFTVTFLQKPILAGNAIISIKFSETVNSMESISIQLDKSRLVEFNDSGLNSDKIRGDGIFTGIAFVSKQEVLTPRLMKGGNFPIFKGREFIGYKKFPPISGVTPNAPITINPSGNPGNIDPERSLMVRDPSVVQDSSRTRADCRESSMGKWSFGYLMSEMANQPLTGITPEEFTLIWLKNWADDQIVNSFTVGQRAAGLQQLLDSWAKNPDGSLDLSRAPFRLLAIVNRPDLRGTVRYGERGVSAGELRFVFGRVDCGAGGGSPYAKVPPVGSGSNTASRHTVIFEYGVKAESCEQVQEWGIRWKKLDQFPLGSDDYKKALEILTEEVVTKNANPDKPNGSALNQLRTNEIAMDSPWELREFQIGDGRSNGTLTEDTIKQTPDASFDNTSTLADFVNQNESDIIAGTHVVPLDFNGSPFLGGAIEYNSTDFWKARGINNNDARHLFSLATCNACHGGEANTGFTHVDPTPFGNLTPSLSGFLRGSTPSTSDIEFFVVFDPVDSTPRKFNDLIRRAADLDALINTPCSLSLAITTNTQMTH